MNGEDEDLARLCLQDTTSKQPLDPELAQSPSLWWLGSGVEGWGSRDVSLASGRCPLDPTWRALAGLGRGPRPE